MSADGFAHENRKRTLWAGVTAGWPFFLYPGDCTVFFEKMRVVVQVPSLNPKIVTVETRFFDSKCKRDTGYGQRVQSGGVVAFARTRRITADLVVFRPICKFSLTFSCNLFQLAGVRARLA